MGGVRRQPVDERAGLMGIVLEFYALAPGSVEEGRLGAAGPVREAGTLVGGASVNSAAVGQFFEWMSATPLAPLIHLRAGGSALVLDQGGIAAVLDRASAEDAPETALAVANALADAVEETLWRGQALAVVSP